MDYKIRKLNSKEAKSMKINTKFLIKKYEKNFHKPQ